MTIQVIADWDMYRCNDTIHFHGDCVAYRRATTRRKGRWTFADGKTRWEIERAIHQSKLKRCKKCFPDDPFRL